MVRRNRKREIGEIPLKVLQEIEKGKRPLSRRALVERTQLSERSVGYGIRKLLAKNLIRKILDLRDARKRLYVPRR